MIQRKQEIEHIQGWHVNDDKSKLVGGQKRGADRLDIPKSLEEDH